MGNAVATATVITNDTIRGVTNNDGIFIYNGVTLNNLRVTCIGYKMYVKTISKVFDTLFITLKNNVYTQQSITILANIKKLKAKNYGYKLGIVNSTHHLLPDMAWVTKVDLSNVDVSTIKAINYYLKQGKNENVAAPFKVLLLSHDTSCNCPGQSLLQDYVVSGAENKTWFNVDISIENIMVSNQIIYIGLQTMPTNFYDNPITTKYNKKNYVEEYKMPSIAFLQKKSLYSYIGWANFNPIKWSNNQFKLVCTATIINN